MGDVGLNHYVAMSNLYFQIYDKTGVSVYGPAANNTLWSGFGGKCESDNAGDPIVLYDQLSDRWILTQFTSPTSGSPYYNCVAVSTTPDPTGTYYRWAFSTGSNFPDYPKYGVWPDALYISTREFAGGSSFAGIGVYAVNRAELVTGNPSPTVVSFVVTPAVAGGDYNIGDGLLPSDLDGTELPPANSPNYYMGSMDDGGQYGAPQDALTLWKFTVDFATPANSSFVLSNTIPIANFDTQFSLCSGRSCIPQPGTSNRVDILSYRQRPIHRLAYRNFGTHESLVTNQSVEAATGVAGNRWWEIRDPNGTPTIYQEGTFAPGVSDGIHRWMASVAMDQSGNMALGYSASDGTSTYPSVWYTGRLVDDPLGTMPQGESSIVDGAGSQTSSQRWGDYSSLNIDPADDCTFWYVNQYFPTSGTNWVLRIGAFAFDTCGCDLVIEPPVASAAVGGDNLVVVSWNDSATPEIAQYLVYRSLTAGGPYTLMATVPDSSPGSGGGAGYSWNDTDVSGGIEYFYAVRSSDGDSCLSTPSTEVSVVATGACTLDPEFAGITSVTNPQLNECALDLEWPAATPVCGSSVVYNIYRSDTSGFTPGPANMIASCVMGTTYTDDTAPNQVEQYYVVRAEDNSGNGSGPCAGGNEDDNVVEQSGAATGPDALLLSTDFETDDGGLAGTLDWEWGTYAYGAGCSSNVPPSAPHSGDKMWGTVLNDCYNNLGNNQGYASCTSDVPGDDSILSFDVDLTGIATADLCWWEWVDLYLPWDPGMVWVNGTQVYEHCDTAATSWNEACIDLTPFANGPVTVEFHMLASSVVERAGWYIDDLRVFYGTDCDQIAGLVFMDDFESATTSAWSLTVP